MCLQCENVILMVDWGTGEHGLGQELGSGLGVGVWFKEDHLLELEGFTQAGIMSGSKIEGGRGMGLIELWRYGRGAVPRSDS